MTSQFLTTALDKNEAAVLVFLDLSAAFVTVDHNMLLGGLSEFGILGTVWNWFKSYLSPRSQRVRVMNACSDAAFLKFGVLQGSVLGHVGLLFIPSRLNSVRRLASRFLVGVKTKKLLVNLF